MTGTADVRFGGLVIGSSNPDKLSAWYKTALAPDSPPGDVLGQPVVVVGGARLVFDQRDDIATVATEPARMQINLFVSDIEAVERHLKTLDVTWVRPLENMANFGSIATFTDPDGNYVQLLAPGARPAAD